MQQLPRTCEGSTTLENSFRHGRMQDRAVRTAGLCSVFSVAHRHAVQRGQVKQRFCIDKPHGRTAGLTGLAYVHMSKVMSTKPT